MREVPASHIGSMNRGIRERWRAGEGGPGDPQAQLAPSQMAGARRQSLAPAMPTDLSGTINDRVMSRLGKSVRDGAIEGLRTTVDTVAGVPHGLFKAGSGFIRFAGQATAGTALTAADGLTRMAGLRNDKGRPGLDLGGARNGWEWWARTHDAVVGEGGLERFLMDAGARAGVRNGATRSDGRQCFPNEASRGYVQGDVAGQVVGLLVAPRPATGSLPSGPIGAVKNALARQNTAVEVKRAADGTTSGINAARELARLEQKVNARTVGLKAGRDMMGSVRSARFDAARAADYARAGRMPAADDLARVDGRQAGALFSGLKTRTSEAFAARQADALAAWRQMPLSSSPLVRDTIGLGGELARARGLATGSPGFAPLHKGWDVLGAGFNHGLARSEPVLNPLRSTLRVAGIGTVGMTSGGLGYGYATGQLRSGQFRQGAPGNEHERAISDYVNMPKDMRHTYVGFWPTGGGRETSFVVACGSKDGIGEYPMAILPGQQGATPRMAIAPGGSSFTANSTILGPAAMCSFNAALDTNRRLSFTLAGINGRAERPAFQMRTAAATPHSASNALARIGGQLGLGAMVTTTDLAVDRWKLSTGNLVSFGAVGGSVGTDGIRLHLSPVAAEPYLSFTTNSSWRENGAQETEKAGLRRD